MNTTRRPCWRWAMAAAWLTTAARADAQQSRIAMVRQADLVFVGTVSAVGAAAQPGIAVSQLTLTVLIDEVLDKPAVVQLAAGDTVTVESRSAGSLPVGAQATFYAKTWLYGRCLAVLEVGHENIPARMSAAATASLRDAIQLARRQVSDSALRARIRAADMVVVGRVALVQPATLATQPAHRRITEHDAEWQEAVIQVESMIKGALPVDQRVVVRFPGSRDVAWRAVPRFAVGQEGTFLLLRDQISGSPTAMMAGRSVTAYAAPTAQDVLTKQDAARVRALSRP